MPSLKNKLPELFLEAYDLSRGDAVMETGISENIFPLQCEWTMEQVLSDEFFPN